MANGAPGGALREFQKWAAEWSLWSRVRVQHALESRGGVRKPAPGPQAPTAVLQDPAEWQRACVEARRVRLPLHYDRPKNWDALGALSTILDRLPASGGSVLDAGCARYSTFLMWLRLYGLTDLWGNNLEWGREFRHGPVRFLPGDMTKTDFPNERFDAITCLSVLEHGVPIKPFLVEAARLLKPGGVLVISTDYDEHPPDTTGKVAYNQPVHIFSPDEVRALVADAADVGLELVGELDTHHPGHVVRWERMGLDFTYIRLAFAKSACG
jgi:SAM-dependent methyltransferase